MVSPCSLDSMCSAVGCGLLCMLCNLIAVRHMAVNVGQLLTGYWLGTCHSAAQVVPLR